MSPVRHNVNMIHGPPRYLYEVHELSYIVLIIMPHVQAMIDKINWHACGPQEKTTINTHIVHYCISKKRQVKTKKIIRITQLRLFLPFS
jgi:hypothetical protein